MTIYDQVGSDFGAGQINVVNQVVNDSSSVADLLQPKEEVVAVVATVAGKGVDAFLVKEI